MRRQERGGLFLGQYPLGNLSAETLNDLGAIYGWQSQPGVLWPHWMESSHRWEHEIQLGTES